MIIKNLKNYNNLSKATNFVGSKATKNQIQHDPKPRELYDFWNNTYYPKRGDAASNIKPWFIIDADGQILGRLATLAASVIRGKMNPKYHPAMDMGDNVIVINAEKVKVTGKKYWMKYYFRHTQNKRSGAGRIGSYNIEYFRDLKDRFPVRIIENAVYGMLPKNRLGKSMRIKHLKVFKGSKHPHCAQDPKDITHLISLNSRCPNFPNRAW